MIKLTWLQAAHPEFQQAVGVINNSDVFDAKLSYQASRIVKKLKKIDNQVKDLRISLMDKFCKKDAQGKRIQNDQGYVEFDTPERQREFEAEFQREFQAREVEIRVEKLPFARISSLRGLAPRMWEFLEPIVDGLEIDDE